jgi:hypothetical protein
MAEREGKYIRYSIDYPLLQRVERAVKNFMNGKQ